MPEPQPVAISNNFNQRNGACTIQPHFLRFMRSMMVHFLLTCSIRTANLGPIKDRNMKHQQGNEYMFLKNIKIKANMYLLYE
jgi:hypothetical protein